MNTNMPKTVADGPDGGGRRRSLWKGPAVVTALVLLIPFLGNQFVDGWNWDLKGFVLVGALVFGIGLTYELVTRNVDALAYRAAVGIALATPFLMVWANFVQFADDVNRAAIWYFGVPIVGIVSATIARFRPERMAHALLATAFAQALALTIVIWDSQSASWAPAVWRGFGGNTLFLILFVASALLFRTAAREGSARRGG
jgi:hypothetical protein